MGAVLFSINCALVKAPLRLSQRLRALNRLELELKTAKQTIKHGSEQ